MLLATSDASRTQPPTRTATETPPEPWGLSRCGHAGCARRPCRRRARDASSILGTLVGQTKGGTRLAVSAQGKGQKRREVGKLKV